MNLTGTNGAGAMCTELRIRLQQQKRLRKNEGLRVVPEERSKQWQLRRRKNFQREKEQEDGMKKWRKDRSKRKVLSKMWNGGKIRAIITPWVTHASDGADERTDSFQARHWHAPMNTKHVKKKQFDMHDSSCAWESTTEALFSERNTSAERR